MKLNYGLTVGILLVGLAVNTEVVQAHGSASTKPSVPALSSPADGATTNDNTPTFSWEASTDSDGHTLTYTIEVSSSADFSTGVTQTNGLTDTSHTPANALADGTWYWRVRAEDPHNVKSQFSSARSLVVDTSAPSAPTASPTGGLFNSAQTVTLSAESGATIRYTTDGSTPTTSSTQYSSALSITSTTTLKAIATDAAGNTSSVMTETYTIDATAPDAPTVNAVTSPVNADSQTVTGTAEANSLVRITGGAATASQQLSGGATAFSISVSLTQDATNTLSVTATDAAGNVSSATTVTIVEDSTGPASPTASPPAGLYEGSVQVTLSAEAGATIYFTLDGTTPTTASAWYQGSIDLSETRVVTAVAVDAVGNAGAPRGYEYGVARTGGPPAPPAPDSTAEPAPRGPSVKSSARHRGTGSVLGGRKVGRSSSHAQVPRVADASHVRPPVALLPFLNRLFRLTHGRIPTTTEWNFWARRILAGEKTSLPAVLGAMEWQRLRGR